MDLDASGDWSGTANCRPFSAIGLADAGWAGGKGANLGELAQLGMPVPSGFVIGAPAYAQFCEATGLRGRLRDLLAGLDAEDSDALNATADAAHQAVAETAVPEAVATEIAAAYSRLSGGNPRLPVAVRSSAIGEDAAAASFAGMHASFLNVQGADRLLTAVKDCWTSLFTARTIYYRATGGLPLAEIDIAVVVQRQLVAKRSGVMFTLDPASGARDRIVIEASFGLGEAIVSGGVSPDRYVFEKDGVAPGEPMMIEKDVRRKEIAIDPVAGGGTVSRELGRAEGTHASITESEALEVARSGLRIEEHYGRAQDIEWAFDEAGALWILQSRPITATGAVSDDAGGEDSAAGAEPALLRGIGAGPGRAAGAARLIVSLEHAAQLQDGEVLVARTTAPDWVPLMRRACAIVTDTGGITCHAAIVARELGIPCVVGTAKATQTLTDGQLVTVDAGAGIVIDGAQISAAQTAAAAVPPPPPQPGPKTQTKILLNLSDPEQIDRAAALDVDGVGLLRAELLVVHALGGVHPQLMVEQGRGGEFVDKMASALEQFAGAFAPRPVTYRTIDFRSNEFRGLEGGERFEPEEANPMIGLRGAQRYVRDPDFFRLELSAIRRVWEAGHHNLHVMLPFVRTAAELARCRELIAESELLDLPGFELWVMAEVPSVLFNLEVIARLGVAGISIGSNDLTQLLLGIDRDSELLADAFDARDPAVLAYLRELIPKAKSLGLQTSICGQAPSIYPEYAEILVQAGIDAISVSIDAVEQTRRNVAAAEAAR